MKKALTGFALGVIMGSVLSVQAVAGCGLTYTFGLESFGHNLQYAGAGGDQVFLFDVDTQKIEWIRFGCD